MKEPVTNDSKKVLWEAPCYVLGLRVPCSKYVLYEDSICTMSGILSCSTRSVPLYHINTKESYSSILSRIFGCGCVKLTLRGFREGDVCLYVRHPQEAMDAIEDAICNERDTFRRNKRSCRQNPKDFS